MDEQLLGCVYCSEPLRPKGFYCPKCGGQIRCKECKELLEKDANACIYCGTEVTAKTSVAPTNAQPVMNTVEYHETRSSRSFRATVTDNVGTSISGVLGAFVGKGFAPKQIKSKFENDNLIEDGAAEFIETDEVSFSANTPDEKNSDTNTNKLLELPEIQKIKKIFRFEEDKTVLIETRLKAQNKIDFVRRLVLLALYGHKLLGKDSIPRLEITKLLISTNLDYGGARSWIAKNGMMNADESNRTVEIIIPGEEQARTYLEEVFNPDIENKWSITTQPKQRKKPKQLDNNQEE